jgi:hypothetical protein
MTLSVSNRLSSPWSPTLIQTRSDLYTSSTEDKILVGFLLRHPFASQSLLEGVFGLGTFRVLLEKEASHLREVVLPGLGPCYIQKDEPNATLLGSYRRAMARQFALYHMGPEAVRAGLSPGFEADGEFYWENELGIPWWRVWVDIGGCSPEALQFIVNPPKSFSDQVRDVVITSNFERLDLLAAQIGHNWCCQYKVRICMLASEAHRVVHPRRLRNARRWKPHLDSNVKALIRKRQQGSHHRSYLAGLALHLSPEDWRLLGEVGNNPLFSAYELAYLRDDASRIVRKEIKNVHKLESLGLIKTARDAGPRYVVENRKILTWRGLELLVEYWGTSVDAMQHYHPWPQREDAKGKGHVEYATRWASRLEAHQRLTRQFTLALLYGARCLINDLGGAEVCIDTTIASRISFKTESSSGEGRISWVAPDSRVHVEFWRRSFIEGELMPLRPFDRRTLLIEVDRGTVPSRRLEARIDKYATIWNTLGSWRPALVWVIDGSPFREKQIVDMIRKRGIEGWTASLERLKLPQEDKWWLIHTPVGYSGRDSKVGLQWKTIGGMAPWRRIWMSTLGNEYQPFMGHEPWLRRTIVN